MNALQPHEYANIFPMMHGDDYERLKSDIAENGLQEPIWLYQEKILDGRNRYKACIEAGVKPEFRHYVGSEPLKFVLSLNLARRHLDTVDVCKVVDSVADIFERQAKERQIEAGGDKKSEEFKKSVVALVPQAIITESKEESAQLPPEPKKPEPKARDLAVAAVGNQVSARTYQDYKKVKTESPELFKKVESKEISVKAAATVLKDTAKLSPERREAVISRISSGEPVKNVMHSSESNEWYTPKRYADLAHAVMGGIDLDPASCQAANQNIQANRIFDIDDGGFDRKWSGRVWLNPPYGRGDDGSNQAAWSQKLIAEYKSGNVSEAMLLVNAATGNKWFADLWEFPICFVDHRIRFVSPQGQNSQPTHSNVIVYLGENTRRFIEVFSEIGVVAGRL